MNKCGALDCLNIDRETHLCNLPFVEVDKRVYCISYQQDKKYLDLLLRQYVRGALQAKGYDPETQEMVDMAKSLNHTPSQKAGEEGN